MQWKIVGDVSSENSEEYLTKPLRESKLIMGFEII